MANNDKPYRTGGYANQRAHHGAPTKGRPSPKAVEFLPHPEVLESYNFIVDGSAQMILKMFEKEQSHRHEWERVSIKIYSYSTLLGQVLGFMIAMGIFGSAAIIGVYGDSTLAAVIWAFGLTIVAFAALIWAYAKSMGQRPLFARPTMRTHFRPEKQKDKMEEPTPAQPEPQK